MSNAFTHAVAVLFIIAASATLSFTSFLPDVVGMAVIFALSVGMFARSYGALIAIVEVLRGRA